MEHQKRHVQHKHLPQGHGVCQYVPYQQSQYSQNTAQQQAGTTGQQQQNTYTPGQTGLQGNLGNLYQQLLQGQIPSSFTNPAAATQAYQNNFNSQVAPGIAAQNGAGSPAIASQQALGLSQLQGQLYNQGVQNYTNALGQGAQYALSPTGVNSNQQTNQTSQQATQGQQTVGANPLVFLANLLGSSGP